MRELREGGLMQTKSHGKCEEVLIFLQICKKEVISYSVVEVELRLRLNCA